MSTKLRGRRVPAFRSTLQESAFWDRHSPLDYGDWEVVPCEEVCRELAVRSERKVPVTLRLERSLVGRLKRAARRHGVKYQTLAREILRRSLRPTS